MAYSELPLVHHSAYVARDVPADHRFPMRKFARLAERLVADGLVAADGFHVPEPADADLLSLAHDRSYVDAVLSASVEPKRARKIGFVMSHDVAMRSRCAVAGTLLAARLALSRGIACNTAGGSHHADFEGGAGFCVFNDVAVAARALLNEGRVSNVLVVDLDVHQGDGTARIFADERRVFTYSVHCAQNYPLVKALSDLDVALPEGTDDAAYLAALSADLGPLLDTQRPDLVFYNAGVDPHREDRLGKMALSDAGLRRRDTFVLDACRSRAIPVCGVLGGGYAHDVDAVARRHSFLHHAAAEVLAREGAGAS